MKRVGLLGGCFDPIHLGHINLAIIARNWLNLDEIQMILTPYSREKQCPKASVHQRIKMLELAISSESKITLNLTETSRKGITYTIDTIKSLPKGNNYTWILGSDQFSNFSSWKEWKKILDQVDLGIAYRAGIPVRINPEISIALTSRCCLIQFVPTPKFFSTISSSQIRTFLSLKKDVKSYLPKLVMEYIFQENLYFS